MKSYIFVIQLQTSLSYSCMTIVMYYKED